MDLNLKCDRVNCSKEDKYDMNVEIVGADNSDILNHFSAKDIVDHFDYDDLLKAIGVDRVKEYFDLVEKTD